MCGIAGVIALREELVEPALARAQEAQAHRGPDGAGTLVRKIGAYWVGLAHRRLAILDTSERGKQPMSSIDSRHWLVHNGEVYNYREIRAELRALGDQFAGGSDTEVMLAAFVRWRIEAIPRFNGMWGFAWLDCDQHRLILSRDRMGVKPLYLYARDDALFFASEIKAVLAMCQEKFEINHQVVGEYVSQSLLETSRETFFNGITKVPAGHNCVIDLEMPRIEPKLRPYWMLSRQTGATSLESAVGQIGDLLADAVRLRLRSDVPVGVLLSGGIDSSSIASCMQQALGREADLNLLSAVSDGSRFDESPFIDAMARHLNRPVTKVRLELDPASAVDLLTRVCWHNDEPVGSFSNVAHYLLMKKARDLGITVILSGQGADEIFCGYKKYVAFAAQALLRGGRLGEAAKLILGFWRRGTIINQFALHEAKRYLPRLLRAGHAGVAGPALERIERVDVGLARGTDVMDRQILDVQKLSVPVLTHYEDRMSMAWAREIRTPFLDYRLVEAAVALPTGMKLSRGWTKYVLRRAMEPLLPPAIAWRKDKLGFVNPEGEWLKRELRPVVLDILNGDSEIFRRGLLSRSALQGLYYQYCAQSAGRGSVSFKEIFQPLALETWLRTFASYLH